MMHKVIEQVRDRYFTERGQPDLTVVHDGHSITLHKDDFVNWARLYGFPYAPRTSENKASTWGTKAVDRLRILEGERQQAAQQQPPPSLIDTAYAEKMQLLQWLIAGTDLGRNPAPVSLQMKALNMKFASWKRLADEGRL
jgi:hypothetical protein